MLSKARRIEKKLSAALKDPQKRPWQALVHVHYEMAYLLAHLGIATFM